VESRTARPPAVPGYQLLEPVGAGGMGEVYLARQLSLGRTVAIKFLNPLPANSPPGRQRESRVMAALAHPHVVAVHDCGRAGDRDYLVMEHVHGDTLRDRLQPGRPWAPAAALPVLDAVADALVYIHGQGVLHLDLKPENVLCDGQGRVKVTDFGLALAEVDAGTLSALGASYHTLDYCPPEQRFGLPVDGRADLFALAVIAYEMLTGGLPGRVYVPASRARSGVPPAVDDVLRRGLERDPEDRYASVAEFRHDLNRALAPPRPGSWRTAALVAGLILTTALSLGLLLARTSGKGEPGPPKAEAHAWVVSDRHDDPNLFDALPVELAARPVAPHGLRPSEGGPPLPAWPEPRPTLVLATPGALAFVHPLDDASLAGRLARDWDRLRSLPPLPARDNFVREPPPGADRPTSDSGSWRPINPDDWSAERGATFARPSDGGGPPALVLTNRNEGAGEVGCYQWFGPMPVRRGSVVVLRFRARVEEGAGRLRAGAVLPLNFTADEAGPWAARLRRVARPPDIADPRPGEEALDYRLTDWAEPGPDWKTYYTVWEWPPFARNASRRNIMVHFAGEGRVRVEQMEVFPWELPGSP
jgi:hypothetical protein